VRDRILEKLPGTESFISEIGAVIGTHAGPGAVGVGLIKAEKR
jgi:fatty acid-binding protein DegV